MPQLSPGIAKYINTYTFKNNFKKKRERELEEENSDSNDRQVLKEFGYNMGLIQKWRGKIMTLEMREAVSGAVFSSLGKRWELAHE